MADVVEAGPLTDAAAAIALGKRHLLVRDFNGAVNTLIQACELLVQKYGDDADELAEPYLLYGRALLNLAREESNVLGSAVPCDKDSDDEVDGEDEEDGDDDDEKDEKDEKSEKDEDEKCEQDKKEEKSDLVKDGETSATSSTENKEDVNIGVSKEENKTDEKKPTESKVEDKTEENHVADDVKAEDESKRKKSKILKDEATPGSSKMTNGESSSGHLNGDVKENGEDEDENDDEDVDNLEVAWEVLELAKIMLLKRGQPGWHLLAEAHKLLGEVAMEGGNASGALTDFHACLDLLQKIEPCNPRAIAEIYYQLGLAYSFASDFSSSIQQFKEAGSVLEARIKELEETSDPPKSEDPFYSVEGEIKELKELLPEIEEKISDMKDAKDEAYKLIIAGIREKVSADGSCSNGASTSTSNGVFSSGAPSGSSSEASSAKPVSDISHLVRKKRKPEEHQVEDASPCKKLSPH